MLVLHGVQTYRCHQGLGFPENTINWDPFQNPCEGICPSSVRKTITVGEMFFVEQVKYRMIADNGKVHPYRNQFAWRNLSFGILLHVLKIP